MASYQHSGDKSQTVVFSSALQREIADYYRKNRNLVQQTDYLLISQKAGKFSSQTIQNLFRDLYAEAGIADASSHSGRRTFITTLSERGVSVRVIQALARHSSLATTQKYIDVSVDKLRSAVENVTI